MKELKMNCKKLWTKDFTIITVGSFISTLGNAASYFTLGVLILKSSNQLYYSVYLTIGTIISFVIPLILGSLVDKYSKKALIVILDYCSCIIFAILSIILKFIINKFSILFLFSIIITVINTLYRITFSSFYANITNHRYLNKGYAINSMIFPIANSIVLPFTSFFINKSLFSNIFIFNSISFFITATIELLVKDKGLNKSMKKSPYTMRLKQGIVYVKNNEAIKSFVIFITLYSIMANGFEALLLPFFQNSSIFTISDYSFVSSISTIGKLIISLVLYTIPLTKYNTNKIIKVLYYCYACIYLIFFNSRLLILVLSIRTFGEIIYTIISNIKDTSSQLYVDDEYRGRFNAISLSGISLGCLIGQLLVGIISYYFNISIATFVLFIIGVIACVLYLKYNNPIYHIFEKFNMKE